MGTIVRKLFPDRRILTLEVGVASVEGRKPLVCIASEVEKAWKKLKAKLGIKERRRRLQDRNRAQSCEELDKLRRLDFSGRRGSDVGKTLSKFKELDAAAQEASKEDVFHAEWKPPQFDKNSPDYGRPKKGSLTEMRGIKAGHDIGKDIVQLVEVITEYGHFDEVDGEVWITFGELFAIYNFISDCVVGMLIRARRHKLLTFEGEMLYQRRDEDVVITLLKTLAEIRQMYEQTNDPAKVLQH